ncbi:MAG TPA: aminotransferase class I/II-fold pyridoxal phosphate-dependent enzyme [Hyphomicrobiaceae bacterium]|nr:aminotransferase class I/II-fold pyridoxal phosphate-dependent enzyme [Hyphomicrobiaceae bacterium]
MEASVAKLSPEDRARILNQSLAHFRNPSGADLIKRTERFNAFIQSRAEFGLWPYSRALERANGPLTAVADISAAAREGINFAAQDYLGLSRHARVVDAGIEAMRQFGPHSAGSAVLLGNTKLSLELEEHVAALLGLEHVTLYPTGWAAGYGAIAAFVRPRDHVVMDYLCHACLQQGAASATPQIRHFIHNDAEDLKARLQSIRAKDARNGIMVITEGVFGMESDAPDLAAFQEACHAWGATLLVDVAHDLGAMGPGGGGTIAAQGLAGKIDLVMGSFAKTFASNGGFLAAQSPAAKQFAKYYGSPHMFSNAVSPVQAAVASEAIRIVRSDEGERLRSRLFENVNALRTGFASEGICALGTPSPVVLVPFGNDKLASLATRRIAESGVFVNLIEYPAVPVDHARLSMQVMASHEAAQIAEAVARILKARRLAEQDLQLWRASAP